LLTSTTFGVFAQRVTIPVVCPHSVRLVGVSTSDTLLSHTRFSLNAAPRVAALYAKGSPDCLRSKHLGITLRYWLRQWNPCVTRKALRFSALLGIAMGPSHTRGLLACIMSLPQWTCPSLRFGEDTKVAHKVQPLCRM